MLQKGLHIKEKRGKIVTLENSVTIIF